MASIHWQSRTYHFKAIKKTISYENQSWLPIFHKMERTTNLSTYNAQTPAPSSAIMPTPMNNQKLLLQWHYHTNTAGLPIESMQILKWTTCNDQNNKISLCKKDALFVPTASMGLLHPQQLSQQAGLPIDSFNSLAKHDITFQGYQKTISYEDQSCLSIFHTMERTTNLSTYNAQTPVLSSTTMSALINNQKLSFLALSYKYTIFNIPYVVVNLARCISCFMFIMCHYSTSGPKVSIVNMAL